MLRIILKNGFYIPFLFPIVYHSTQHILLSTTITLKLFPANYMFWYSHKFDYLFADRRYNQIKQFVRFTDTGYLASVLAHHYLPIAFNVHFAITFGYWIAKLALGLDDVDRTNGPTYSMNYERFWGALIHGIPLIVLIYSLSTQEYEYVCPDYFSPRDLTISWAWLWIWFFAVYIPWNIRTGDPVYSFMGWNVPIMYKLAVFLLMHLLLGVSNVVGRYIHVVANH